MLYIINWVCNLKIWRWIFGDLSDFFHGLLNLQTQFMLDQLSDLQSKVSACTFNLLAIKYVLASLFSICFNYYYWSKSLSTSQERMLLEANKALEGKVDIYYIYLYIYIYIHVCMLIIDLLKNSVLFCSWTKFTRNINSFDHHGQVAKKVVHMATTSSSNLNLNLRGFSKR